MKTTLEAHFDFDWRRSLYIFPSFRSARGGSRGTSNNCVGE